MKEKIFRKLQSRKFWVALSTIISGVMMMFGYAESSAEVIAGAIVAAGGAIGYMLSEGMIDAASVKKIVDSANTIVDVVKDPDVKKNIL